jgi:predicted exporter/trans-aconitate methyltransferase
MTEHFVALHLWLARHRRGVLLLGVVFAVAAVFAGRRLKLNEDFTDFLPMSSPAIAEQVEALRHIRQAERLYIDVATTTTNADQLAAAAGQMTAALRGIPGLADVRGEIDLADLGAAYQQLRERLPGLLNAGDLRTLEARLTTTNLVARLAWLKKSMMQPQGMMFKDLAQTDPAGLSDTVSVRLRDLQAGTGDARIVDGRITSANGCHVLLNATPEFRSSETGKSAALIAATLQAARSVERQFPAGAVKIAVTGAHRAALDNATMIRQDTTRTSLIATLAIAGLILFASRRRWLALLALLPVVFGALGAVTVFYLTGDLVSSVALGCGSMLIGVTVDYGIYLVYMLDDAPPASRTDLARGVAALVPALVFGALTTMAAFLVMFLSPVSGHRQLGLFGAVGVGLAAVFALFILPLCIPVKALPGAPALPLTALLQRLFDWRRRNERSVLALLVLFTLVMAVGVSRVKFDGELARLNGVTRSTQQDEQAVRETWGQALSLTTIVVGGSTREEVLAKNERILAALAPLRGRKVLESFSSVAPLLPSAQTRATNGRAWREFWTAGRQAQLRDALAAAGAQLGFRAGAFAPFLEDLSAPEPAVQLETNGALDRLVADFWSERDGRMYLTTLVKVAGAEKFRELHTAVKASVPDALLLNKAVLSEEVTQVVRRTLPVFGLLVAALNALLMFALLGRVELVLVTLLPMAAGIFWTLGTLGLCGLPIDVANFVFVIFVVGVGGDYSLFLILSELEALRGRSGRTAVTGGAVTLCALTALMGTGVLVLAHHPALFSVGLTALLGISYSLLATLLLVPLSVRWLAEWNSRRPNPANPTSVQMRRAVGRFYRFQGPYVSQFVYWKMRTDPLFQALDLGVPARGEILDLGCGFGLVAHWLTMCAPERRVRGVDFDADKIRVAQVTERMNPRVSFELRDLLEWPRFAACDVALLCDVLHYFPRELKTEVLRKVFAALRPGGCLILRDAMARDDFGHYVVARSEAWAVHLGQNRTRHGLHFEDEATHRALLQDAGFVDIAVRNCSGLGSNVLLVASKAGAVIPGKEPAVGHSRLPPG